MYKLLVSLVVLGIASAEIYHYEDIPEISQESLVRVRRQGSFGGGFSSFNFGGPYPSRSYGGYRLSNLNPNLYSFTPNSNFQPAPRFNFGSATAHQGAASAFKGLPIEYRSQTVPISRLTGLSTHSKSLSYNGQTGSASVSTIGVPGGPISGSAVGSVPLARFGTTKEGGSLSFGAGADFTQGQKIQPKVELGVKGIF